MRFRDFRPNVGICQPIFTAADGAFPMIRRFFLETLVSAGLALSASTVMAQHFHANGSCTGHSHEAGGSYYPPVLQAPLGPVYPTARPFAGDAAHDCAICRGEREVAFPAPRGPIAREYPDARYPDPSYPDPSDSRPSLVPLNPTPNQAGRVPNDPYAGSPYAGNNQPPMMRGNQRPFPTPPSPYGRDMMMRGNVPQQVPVADGMAVVLQDDSPLMSAADQLGSIDRGQSLRVLSIQGNWVQLETTWLQKNAWIRKNLVQMNDNIQPPNDIAPPAT